MKIPVYTDFPSMMPPRNHVQSTSGAKYHRMKQTSADSAAFTDDQFAKPPSPVPYKAIFLASVLLTVGSLLIIIGALLVAGVFDDKYSDRTWPLLVLGVLMFIPGAYHVRIAWYAYKGYEGYSYEDIPEFD